MWKWIRSQKSNNRCLLSVCQAAAVTMLISLPLILTFICAVTMQTGWPNGNLACTVLMPVFSKVSFWSKWRLNWKVVEISVYLNVNGVQQIASYCNMRLFAYISLMPVVSVFLNCQLLRDVGFSAILLLRNTLVKSLATRSQLSTTRWVWRCASRGSVCSTWDECRQFPTLA